MSRIHGEIDDNNVICPYCKYFFQAEGGDFNESSEDLQCDECGKFFEVCMVIMYDYRTEPNCELNREQHDYILNQYGNTPDYMSCVICGKGRLTDEATKRIQAEAKVKYAKQALMRKVKRIDGENRG